MNTETKNFIAENVANRRWAKWYILDGIEKMKGNSYANLCIEEAIGQLAFDLDEELTCSDADEIMDMVFGILGGMDANEVKRDLLAA